MGIRKVQMCPDLSWIYHMDHQNKMNNTQVVMVNLRNAIFDDQEQPFIDATLQKCEEILYALNDALDGHLKVCVAYQTAEETVFSRVVYERLRESFDTEYIGCQMKLDEFEQYYGGVDYHISNRMHSLLVGYKYGSLPIALIDTEKHVKIAATFNDCGLDDLMVDIHEGGVETKAHAFVHNRKQLLQRFFTCEEELGCRMQAILSKVFE